MIKRCKQCGSTSFRLSRLRRYDFIQFLLLRYPVRCLGCLERSSISLFRARKFRRHRKRGDLTGKDVLSR